jgi:hypothetical protein
VGYRFTLVLSREVTAEESTILEEAGCAGAVFGSDTLPTNAEVPVTKMDFDVTESPSLADAIESALDAVKKVPELSVPGLTVPAQPAHAETADSGVIEGVVVETAAADSTVVAAEVTEEEPAAKKAAARKPAAKKPAAKKPPVKKTATADGAEPVEATAGTS